MSIRRYFMGCCSYQASWAPGEEGAADDIRGWGKMPECLEYSYVDSKDYDKLYAEYEKLKAKFEELGSALDDAYWD